MTATGRDVATFALGLALAGLAPVFLLPSLEPSVVLSLLTSTTGGIPVEEVAVLAFVAMLGAAWLDTQRQPMPDRYDWE